MRRAILASAWLMLMVVTASHAAVRPSSDGSSPVALIRDTFDTVGRAVLVHQEAIRNNPRYAYRLIESMVAPRLDFKLISRLVLGPYWNHANPGQRRRFVAAFKRSLMQTGAVLLAQHVDAVAAHFANGEASRVVIEGGTAPHGAKRTSVRMIVPDRGRKIVLVYRLHRGRRGWKAYDVTLWGISLLFVYRQEFDAMIRQDGMDTVIKRMVAHNAAVGLP